MAVTEVRVDVPAASPHLTVAAARALLEILIAARPQTAGEHGAVAQQQAPVRGSDRERTASCR